MRQLWFLTTKIAGMLLTLLIASMLIFAAMHFAPGDPAAMIAGPNAREETLAAIEYDFGLNDPVLVQYFNWLMNVLQGEFGRSYVFRSDVMSLITPRLAITLSLVAYAGLIIIVLGVGLGILAAFQEGWISRSISAVTSFMMGIPTFVVAILLITIFSQYLSWFPVYGTGAGFGGIIKHLTLPAISLACAYLALVARITRTSVRGEMFSEHVETARARGMSLRYVIPQHVLKNASSQIFQVSGLTLAGLFAGTAIAEQAFGISGVGSLLVEAATRQDVPVVQILTLFMVVLYVVVNTAVDLINAAIDPRMIQSGSKA